MHSPLQFMELPLSRRIRCVEREGVFVATRKGSTHTLDLYSLYGFLAEVWYDPASRRIFAVLPLWNPKKLDSYTNHLVVS